MAVVASTAGVTGAEGGAEGGGVDVADPEAGRVDRAYVAADCGAEMDSGSTVRTGATSAPDADFAITVG